MVQPTSWRRGNEANSALTRSTRFNDGAVQTEQISRRASHPCSAPSAHVTDRSRQGLFPKTIATFLNVTRRLADLSVPRPCSSAQLHEPQSASCSTGPPC